MDLKKEVSQAVVFVENDAYLAPVTIDQPKVLLPLANRPILAYTLDMLSDSNIEESFLFCDQHASKIKEFVERYKKNHKMKIEVYSSEDYTNLGAVMRDLDSRGVIKSNFVLVGGGCVGNLHLDRLVEVHKQNVKNDPGCVMTCIFKPVSPKHRARFGVVNQNPVLALNLKQKVTFLNNSNRKSIEIPADMFEEDPQLSLHYDLFDTHVAICSEKVPPDFSDNFDFETRDNFIHGLLIDRELLRQHIYVHILGKDYYAARVDDARSYANVTCDLLQRFVFPIVPDAEDNCSFRRNNVYLEDKVHFSSKARLMKNVAISHNAAIGMEATLIDSVIGANCHIGDNVVLKNSYIFNGTNIGNYCQVENCIIDTNVTIGDGCQLNDCLIANGVILAKNIKLTGKKLLYDPEGEETNHELVGKEGRGTEYAAFVDPDDDDENGDEENEDDDDDDSDQDGKSEHDFDYRSSDDEQAIDQADDPHGEFESFFYEVYDSLHRGIEEKTIAENIILEINSSKHAYNVPVNDVNKCVVKAVLQISLDICKGNFFPALKSNLAYALPILKNYIKTVEGQNDCIYAIEEFHLANNHNEQKRPNITEVHLVKILQYLYEEAVLEEDCILQWFYKPQLLAEHDKEEQETLRQTKELRLFVKWLEEAEEESSEEDEGDG